MWTHAGIRNLETVRISEVPAELESFVLGNVLPEDMHDNRLYSSMFTNLFRGRKWRQPYLDYPTKDALKIVL